MPESDNHLVRIFKDASAHKEVARMISRHLSSKEDIRDVALNDIDLSKARNILDLGCGFGFFTEGLKNKNHKAERITGIDCHPELEWFYFQSCEAVDHHIKKKFISRGCNSAKNLETASYDLVLCSYALYFFPELIREISRILKKDGLFIVITHATPHLHQFTDLVRELLSENGIILEKETPYESLIGKFSDKNGMELLNASFHTVCTKAYKSTLVFRKGDFESFASYFNFKHSFFIPRSVDPTDRLHQMVLDTIKDYLDKGKELHITKDDMIFICSDPIEPKSS